MNVKIAPPSEGYRDLLCRAPGVALHLLMATLLVAGLVSCAPMDTTDSPDRKGLSASVCGNGELEPGEECDDRNRIDGDGCSRNCEVATCPNNEVEAHETCDDGNREDGDGCSRVCALECTADGDCPERARCVMGQCELPRPEVCNGINDDFDLDQDIDEETVDGLTNCDNACVDLRDDAAHCGRCENPCAAEQVCHEMECYDAVPDWTVVDMGGHCSAVPWGARQERREKCRKRVITDDYVERKSYVDCGDSWSTCDRIPDAAAALEIKELFDMSQRGANPQEPQVMAAIYNMVWDELEIGGDEGAANCDESGICSQVLSCFGGLLYPTGCGPSNCDAPMGRCERVHVHFGTADRRTPFDEQGQDSRTFTLQVYDGGASVTTMGEEGSGTDRAPTSCRNGLPDGGETGLDCGGPCAPCGRPSDGEVAVKAKIYYDYKGKWSKQGDSCISTGRQYVLAAIYDVEWREDRAYVHYGYAPANIRYPSIEGYDARWFAGVDCSAQGDLDSDGVPSCEDLDDNDPSVGREHCTDRLDNDVDGIEDCEDRDCADHPACFICRNEADAAIHETVDVSDAVKRCGLSCVAAPDPDACLAQCIDEATSLSDGCRGCYAGRMTCTMDSCLAACVADPAAVMSCVECLDAHCAGGIGTCVDF